MTKKFQGDVLLDNVMNHNFWYGIIRRIHIIYNFRIALYSTASTENAAYIIGGSDKPYIPDVWSDDGYSTTIAEYKNGQWSKLGDLEWFYYLAVHLRIFYC